MRGPARQSNGFLSALDGSDRDHTAARVGRRGVGRRGQQTLRLPFEKKEKRQHLFSGREGRGVEMSGCAQKKQKVLRTTDKQF